MNGKVKRVIIAGGSGDIGRGLADALARDGYVVVILSRKPDKVRNLMPGQSAVLWDARTADGWGTLVNGATAVVHLTGASIGIPPIPWTSGRRRLIRSSRIGPARALSAAVNAATERPSLFVQQSAVGYYGLSGDTPVTEADKGGSDFMAQVCREWEDATADVEALGVRRVITRTGVILDRRHSILDYMGLPFRFFVGGPLGSGRQWMSWMHMTDEVNAMRFLIEHPAARGAYNLCAPQPVTNAEFSRLLGRVLHRPSWLRVPGFALKLMFGELAELLLLGGQRVLPQRLLEAGYVFRFPDLESALHDALGR